MPEGDEARRPSARSLRSLDALNLTLADVRDGLGPYLAIYLGTQNWSPDRVGWAMAMMGAATVAAQTPAGALIDRSRHKRSLIVGACVCVAIGSVAMVARTTFPVILASQALIGVAAAIFAPAIAALSLGLVGHGRLSGRMGRNEAWNHAGNVLSATLAGVIGTYWAYEGIFYLTAFMAGLTAICTMMLRPSEIDHELARGGEVGDAAGSKSPATLRSLFTDRRILIFSASVVLFHFANAAMLPLVGQKLTKGHPDTAAAAMSACIIAAQLVMVPVALWACRKAETWGRKAVFLVGFGVLPIRGLLYIFSTNAAYLVGVQLLDGIGAGIIGVVGVLVIADLTKGTGRFNLMQGALATATGIGASLSNLLTGYVVKFAGFNAGFIFLAIVAAVALAFFGMLMPETKVGNAGREAPRDLAGSVTLS